MNNDNRISEGIGMKSQIQAAAHAHFSAQYNVTKNDVLLESRPKEGFT